MKRRSIVVMLILCLITFGIYSIFWQCSFQGQLKKQSGKGFGAFGHFLMCLFTFGIYPIYWNFAAGKRLVEIGVKSDYSILYLILGLVGFGVVNMFVMQVQANEIA